MFNNCLLCISSGVSVIYSFPELDLYPPGTLHRYDVVLASMQSANVITTLCARSVTEYTQLLLIVCVSFFFYGVLYGLCFLIVAFFLVS